MGTSAPHPGSGPLSPLVPDYADAGGPDPVPPPQPERFKAFRTRLGAFASTGSPDHLRVALKHFATTSLGGSAAGSRRFGSMARAGATMLGAFTSPGGLRQTLVRSGIDLATLRGASLETVIQVIARAFTPNDADGAKTETALREALEIALDEQNIIDLDLENFQGFDEETYVKIITYYIQFFIVQHILSEGKKSMDRARTGPEQMTRENQLREAVAEVVGVSMIPLVQAGITNMSPAQLERLQISSIASVLSVWEAYDE
jgi:hypothetical protein